jgi:hypothetical protein
MTPWTRERVISTLQLVTGCKSDLLGIILCLVPEGGTRVLFGF